MSNALELRLNNLGEIIQRAAPDFAKLAKVHGAVHFEREASFALQILKANDYLAEIAANNPDSLKYAILNVASIGLSLNPVTKEAYLVPRKVDGKKQICLDPSYRGLASQAVRSGAIDYVQAEVVCEKDSFRVTEVGRPPIHDFDPFHDRGKFVGAYCVAKLSNGDAITTVMSTEEIRFIAENYSEAFKKNSGPWVTDTAEMFKKTVIKRAAKLWPPGKTDDFVRTLALDEAANPTPKDVTPPPEDKRSHSFEDLRMTLKASGRTEAQLIEYAAKKFRREVLSLEVLTDVEISQLNAFLKTVKPIEKKEGA